MQQESKETMRARLLATRAAVRNVSGEMFAEQFVAAEFNLQNKIIAAYLPTKDEADCKNIIENLLKAGQKICLPFCVAKDAPLLFRIYTNETQLAKDAAGMLAPPDTAATLTPDIIITPLVAFDENGGRLGRGGGHYDRTLSTLNPRPLTIGLAFAAQLVPQVPQETHDQPLDYVLTESKLFDFRKQPK